MGKKLAGYVRTLFGSGDDAGTVVVSAKGRELARFTNVQHWFPVTPDALDAAFAALEHTIQDVDGAEHVLRGRDAAAAKYFQHALESVRGSVRTDLLKGRDVSPELVQARFDAATTFGGRSRSGAARVVASERELDGLSKEEVIALFRSRGAVA